MNNEVLNNTTTKYLKEFLGNKFFTVKFRKKDGSIRVMNARLGVKKYLSGGQLKYNPESYNNLIVFDLNKKAYRTIKLDQLIELSFKGKNYLFENNEIVSKNKISNLLGKNKRLKVQ